MTKYAKGKFKPTNPDKYLGKQLPTYRSSWEQRFMMFCDTNTSVLSWASEPVKIPYFNPVKNKQTIYKHNNECGDCCHCGQQGFTRYKLLSR